MRRIEAAQMLAKDIDGMSTDYNRVILIGHSHGGNIALLATALCNTEIDCLVCLATPHVYLRVVDGEQTDLNLPVYCSPQTLRNTDRIMCFCAKGDLVVDDWSNALLTGVSEMEALELTREWRALTGSPRLADDGLMLRLLESDNLFASNHLTLATHNQVVSCEVRDPSGIKQHNAIHSCDMGKALGQLLSDDQSAELAIDRIPEDADVGVR
jgi:pimeloyl-ACP methyl ester carboxylesterase